jgi:hypothetical protein
MVKMPTRVRQATVRQLVDLREQHLKNKPRKFIWKVFPSSLYSYYIADWKEIDKKLTELLSFNKPVALDTLIQWYG